MKRMVGIVIMAVFACALFLAPHASAQFEIVNAWVEPPIGGVSDEFTYYVNAKYLGDAFYNVPVKVNLTYGPNEDNPDCNKSKSESVLFNPAKNGSITIPFENIYLKPLKSCDDEFKNFTIGEEGCEWEKCWYNFTVNGETRSNVSYPKITLPKPKITRFDYPYMLYYSGVLDVRLYVKDEFGKQGKAELQAINLSSGEDKWASPKPPTKPPYDDHGLWIYEWRLPKDKHLFTKDDKCFYFSLQANYTGLCGKANRTGKIHITEYIPKIVGGPYLNATADAFKFLGKNNKTEIDNIEWKDLDEGNFSFSVTIEDKIEKGNATLQVYRIKNNTITNYSLRSGEGEGFPYEYKYYNESIRFDRNDANTTILLCLNYSRPNLPSEWWNEWPKVYNLTMIPFEIDFKNATVKPEKGNWSDEFKYSVLVNASKDISIDLEVFDPCLETWPWRPAEPPEKYFKNGWKTLNWTIKKANPIFSENCSGESKFYFKYEGGKTQVYSGPVLISIPPPPPEFDNDSVDPNITIYCNWSNSSTPCNYSVNVSTEDEYKVRLLVKDPTDKKWIPKGEIKDISSKTKNPVTWYDIKPFKSLNTDNITQYIGKQANFTFEYDGHRYEEKPPFPGPELVAAFRDPKVELEPEDEVINYNDTFFYKVDVTGSEKLLNITLRYLCDGKWISENITKPTKEYTSITKWQPLNWTCKAINSWEEVRFDVNVTGREKPIEVY